MTIARQLWREASSRLDRSLVRLRWAIAGTHVLTVARWLEELSDKANFNPNQPRVPRGQGRESGRWVGVPGRSRGGPPGSKPDGPSIKPESEGRKPANLKLPPDSERPPKISKHLPPTRPLRNAVIKRVAGWALRIGIRLTPVGRILDVIQAAEWIYEYGPYVTAYLDGPKSLAELHAGASNPGRGYDIHHVVEQTPAEKDGFPRELIDAPENLVRISTLRHWELTAWYARGNSEYGGMSPRDYLRGKTWEERYRFGLEALVEFGVLRP